MALDPSIILAGQPVNVLGAISAGNEAAAFQNDALHQQGYRNMLAQNGAGIMAGDQNALNALAGYDPQAALTVQDTRLGMEAKRQSMDILSAQEKRAAETYAAGLTKEQRAAEAAAIEAAVKQGMMIPDAASWDAFMSQSAPELVGQFGNREALAAQFMGWADVLKQAFPEPEKVDLTSDQKNYQFYAEQETQAGRQPLSFNDWTLQGKKAGATTVTIGGLDGPEPKIGDVYTPGGVGQAIDLIDEIMNDPALSGVVGSLEGGGGNNPDEIGIMQRGYYGNAGMGVIAKIGQLQSQSWMAARAMLKGGGQITDYESRKAEAAVARLTRAQGEKEFRAALQDLRDAITDGMAKLEGKGGALPAAPADNGAIPEGISPEEWEAMPPEDRALFQ